jgi:hypothetical protein
MREHPIPFIDPLVQKILADEKTQTRRLPSPTNCTIDGPSCRKKLWARLDFSKGFVDPGPSPAGNAGPYLKIPTLDGETVHRVYPRVNCGDRLWVRETHGYGSGRSAFSVPRVVYRATAGGPAVAPNFWRPPMFMKREHSRINLEVTRVRIERLQELTHQDAIAEGMESRSFRQGYGPAAEFYKIWNRLHANGADGDATDAEVIAAAEPRSWEANPWVLVYEFKRAWPVAALPAAEVAALVGGSRFHHANERELQDGIAEVLAGARVEFKREVWLGAGAVIDFLLPGGIGLEVKVAGTLAAVTRQLHRYAGNPKVSELLLVTSRPQHDQMPVAMQGKPVRVVTLLGGLS